MELDIDFYHGNEYPKATLGEFLTYIDLPENINTTYELINGRIVMMAGNTSFNHQRISGYIARKIGNYLDGKQCEVVQDVNVFLYSKNVDECKYIFQPDVMVGCDKTKMTKNGYNGAPEFVVEIISKSTAKKDHIIKFAGYMWHGVKEYWIVDMYKQIIWVYTENNEQDFPDKIQYTFNDTIKVGIFDDLYIDFNEILAAIDLTQN